MVVQETKIKHELQVVLVASVHGYSKGVSAQSHIVRLSRPSGFWPTGIGMGELFQVNLGSLTVRQ